MARRSQAGARGLAERRRVTTAGFTESVVEDAALAWLEHIVWQVAHGPDVAPDTPGAERASYAEVVLERRLRDALARLKPELPAKALEEAFRNPARPEGAAHVYGRRESDPLGRSPDGR